MATASGEALAVEGLGEADWDFDLQETVTLLWSGETGLVVGRTEYVHRDAQYLVEYTNSNGEQVRQWLYGDAIDHVTVQ